ncbi:MAG: methyltransferase domain-containing protein [Caldilineaceae bacterium]|nr:methyltransferase domain-containing protein [Caldilineaceae bacterium]
MNNHLMRDMDDMEWYPTANSRTPVAFDPAWRVMDVGSGHNPHPRADVIVERYLEDVGTPAGRSGRAVVRPAGAQLVIADGTALPFGDKAFDFIVCSHVAEHVEEIDGFCRELNRVGQRGFIETPGKWGEYLRHPRYHRWFVSLCDGALCFDPAPVDHPLGALGKLFYSIYFYRGRQLASADVYAFAHGAPRPLHYGLVIISRLLHRAWQALTSLTHTRLLWQGEFRWRVRGGKR